ncbi:odorant binding protein, antennal [Anopheles darlingi]|uniref:Odorant binding protein, antennal n=1 Tax=Anopheles darlingi TaxID=43151 RepID=W5JMD0_ANODA|nr:general odorant-binding protein 69a [Anopheles darlingi]ETN64065.1 odorant binding protein, antennal [Anopheles darlingi]
MQQQFQAVLLAACYFLACSNAFEIPDRYKKPAKILHETCVSESGASEELLRQCLDGTIHADKAVQCYIHCLFDKIGVIEPETGRIFLEWLTDMLPTDMLPTDMQHAIAHLTRECGHIVTEDKCNTAYQTAKCYFSAHEDAIKFCHLLILD